MSFDENDAAFLNQVHSLIRKNIGNPHFGVSELAEAILMHRSSLSRKLGKLTGQSPSELIEEMRMTKARDLITSTDLPISQIIFEVGYTELSNFSRAFKRYFGEPPSNVRNQME